MKLLVLCERVDGEGGTETYLRDTLSALRDAGHIVAVVARSVRQGDAYGVPAHEVAWSDEHDPPSERSARAVGEIAASFGPDAVAAHNVLDAGVLDAARAHTGRFAYHVHDHRPFCPNGDRLYPQGGGICGVRMGHASCGFHALVNGCAYGPRPRTLSLVSIRERVANVVRDADCVVTLSRYVAGLAARNGVARGRIATIAPPLAAAAFATPPAPHPARRSVLFAGRVMPSKGGRSLVRALALLPRDADVALAIAGDGPDLAATLAEAAQRGVPAQALGRLDAAALRNAIDDASLLAVPSLWGEPFGLIGIEAFARGRPVVAYDAGAIGEWLDERAGRLVARGDEAALARAIASLLDDRAAWETASAAARADAERYRLEPHVARLIALYERGVPA